MEGAAQQLGAAGYCGSLEQRDEGVEIRRGDQLDPFKLSLLGEQGGEGVHRQKCEPPCDARGGGDSPRVPVLSPLTTKGPTKRHYQSHVTRNP